MRDLRARVHAIEIALRRLSRGAGGALPAHASSHAIGGSDRLTPEHIGAAASGHDHGNIYAPASHAQRHAVGGADRVYPSDIGAAPADHSHGGEYAPATHNHSGSEARVSHSDLTGVTSDQHHPRLHSVTGSGDHYVNASAGLFIKTGPGNTVVAEAHGLTYSDVGAAAASHTHPQLHDRIHDIASTDHYTSQPSGKFVKTGAGGTIVVADHGLTHSDVGAAAATHTHSQLHDRLHSVTSTSDHSFPGGTTTFLRADGTWAAPPSGGGSTPPWYGVIYGAGLNCDPGLLLSFCTGVGVVSPTPTNIGTSTARCSLFRPPADITVRYIYFYGVGAVSGAYRLAIYNYSTKAAVLGQTAFDTTANAWSTITLGSPVTLYAGTMYVLAVAVSTTGTTAGVLAFTATTAATAGVIAVAPESWPTVMRPSSGYLCCGLSQFAVTSGTLPSTMPNLAAGTAWTGGMPAFWLSSS